MSISTPSLAAKRSLKYHWVARYGAGGVGVAAAFLIREGLTRLAGGSLPHYITFYPIVMAAALFGGVGPGLLATLTVATLVSVVVFRGSAVAAPGFPQLIIAALVGTLVGALAATVLWRLTLPIRRHLPARP